MIRRLLFGACLALFPAAAFADDTAAAAAVAVSPAQNTALYYAHLGVLLIGLFYSGIVAAQAFGREVKFDDVPTFPRYMTRKSQYMSGLSCFVLVSMLTFFLLVYLNKEVTPIIDIFNHDFYEKVKKNIDGELPSYFVIVVLISVLFVALFHWENDFNPVLMFRNLI